MNTHIRLGECPGYSCFVCLFYYCLTVNSYGHVGTVTSNFVGLLPNIKMNVTSSPAIKHYPSKVYAYMQGWSDIPLILGRLRPSRWLTSTQELSQCAARSAQRHLETQQFFKVTKGTGLQADLSLCWAQGQTLSCNDSIIHKITYLTISSG